MISKKQVLQDNADYKTLINAVINRIGLDSVNDVNNNGISGGYGGFIYYSDTLSFYKRYRRLINKLVFEMAEIFGEDPVNMIASFRCVNDDADTRKDIGKCIYGGNINGLLDNVHIPNALSWFAAEEVCRMFDN
jgi:hypothetical protein